MKLPQSLINAVEKILRTPEAPHVLTEGRKEVIVEDYVSVLKQIPQQTQSQSSLFDQLTVLTLAANKLGLYDAADFLTRHSKLRK